MITASAALSDQKHARLENDVNHLDWSHLITLARNKGITTTTATTDDGANFLERSLKSGLLHVWGYDKMFKVTAEV